MRDIDGALRRASRAFSPHRVDEVYVNVSTALFIEAEDLRFGALEFFRVLDPRGRVVLYRASRRRPQTPPRRYRCSMGHSSWR